LPKTTSGKIKRFDIKSKVENKEVKEVSGENSWKILLFFALIYNFFVTMFSIKKSNSGVTSNAGDLASQEREKRLVEIKEFLVSTVAKQLDVSEIDPDSPLIQYGLKSIDAVAICAGIVCYLKFR
jgi:hypothetical protein